MIIEDGPEKNHVVHVRVALHNLVKAQGYNFNAAGHSFESWAGSGTIVAVRELNLDGMRKVSRGTSPLSQDAPWDSVVSVGILICEI